ncbi:MAG: ATP-binding protein [Synechococcales bacterium]|nr:ATP-binding protein [Synechococcales bacterium]
MQVENCVNRVLIVEDNAADAAMLKRTFARVNQSWQVVHVSLLSNAIEQYQASLISEDLLAAHIDSPTSPFTLILLDLGLPDADGLTGLTVLRELAPEVTIVILTGLDDEALALQAMAEGAQDYLIKDSINSQRLTRSIRYAIERQQLLRKLQESERLSWQMLQQEKELNQLKSSFISTVSHEFRNPLAVIRTAADLIRLNGKHLSAEKQQRFLSQIIYSVDNLLDWINEILLMNRMEAQGVNFSPSWIDFQQFCEQLVDNWQLSAGDRCSLKSSIQGDFYNVWLDSALMHHVCNNLLSNAVKYSREGGLICLEVQRQVTQQQEWIFLTIQDQGIGIPADQMHRVFDSFYRCSNTDGIAGTGLGLAIAKGCVEAHQGTLTIHSKLGEGTTVVVRIPYITEDHMMPGKPRLMA